jgi:Mlc titration factor MtfA (ptsG expression regulator)
MIFSWYRNRRRRQLANRPFPVEGDQWIGRNVAHAAGLSPEEYASLRQWIQIFRAEKYWEGCDGLQVTEEMQATIAAHAGYMVRGKEDYYYDHLRTILIYPQIVWRASSAPQGGVVSEGPSARLGEALQSGPVSLVWPHVLSGGRREEPGRNVVFHEFAHVLDWEDQFLDGTPHLDSAELFEHWEQTINAEYQALVNAARRGHSTLIDPYGATNIAEFFAVSTECFFEQPHLMSHRHPEWFGLLKAYYKINPLDDAP